MRKQLQTIVTVWVIREVVHLLLAVGAVGLCFWFLHYVKGMML